MLVIDLVKVREVDFFDYPVQGKANARHGLFTFKSGDGDVRLSVQALVEALLVSRREVELAIEAEFNISNVSVWPAIGNRAKNDRLEGGWD